MSHPAAAELRQGILDDFERLMQHVARWRQVGMIDVDVTMPQARCLMLVGIRPGISISALAAQLHVGLPAASGLVERLVEAGYVERNVDPNDRRHQLVTLSGHGRTLVERFHELPSARLGELLDGLTSEELRGLRVGVAALERESHALTFDPAEDVEPERTTA